MNVRTSRWVGVPKALPSLVLSLMFAAAKSANGQGTLFSQTGAFDQSNSGYNRSILSGDNLIAITWSSSVAFVGVNISIPVYGAPGYTGEAFLTHTLGAGTVAGNEVASASFAFPSSPTSSSQYTTVLSGLNLAPGRYYLTIEETDYSGRGGSLWYGTGTPNYSIADNVIPGSQFSYYGSIPDYAPSAAFVHDQGPGRLDFNITYSAVPEPSGLWLITLAGGIASWSRRVNKMHSNCK